MLFSVDDSTPAQLHEAIGQSSLGFSIDGNSIRYLGRALLLRDGKVFRQEGDSGQREAGDLLDRLISLRPDLRTYLPDSTLQAINSAAAALVKAHGSQAVKFAPTQTLKHAVALEYIGHEFHRINAIKEVADFSASEKYQLICDAQHNCQHAYNFYTCRWLSDLTPVDRFQLIIDSLELPEPEGESFPGHIMCKDNCVRTAVDVVTQSISENSRDTLKIARDLIDVVDIQPLASSFYGAVDQMEREFLTGSQQSDINWSINLSICASRINNLLYLVAATSYIPDGRDISELMPYLQTILDNGHHSYYQWFARDILWQLNNSGSAAEFTRFFAGVVSVIDHTTCSPLDVEAVREIIDNLQPLTQTLYVRLNVAGHKFPLFMQAFTDFVAPLRPEYRRALTELMSAMEKELTSGLNGDDGQSGRLLCSERLSRFLLLVRLCEPFADPGIELQPYLRAIIASRERSNLHRLINALTGLLHCNHETQAIFSPSGISGGDMPILARLALAPLRQRQLLSDDELKGICDNLNNGRSSREQLKNVVVFNQWLVTTEKLGLYTLSSGFSVGRVFLGLTQDMANILVRLGYIFAVVQIASTGATSEEGSKMLSLLGLDQSLTGEALTEVLEQVADGFAQHPSPVCQWLWQQRYPHLLPLYVNNILSLVENHSKEIMAELMGLIDLFITSSISGQFVAARHDTRNNPHLAEIYRQRPDLASGWSASCGHFSDKITGQSKHGFTLSLTEDPWDLFVSGFEVKSCMSPGSTSGSGVNRCLMSYVMDGRNAMLVQKNARGNIVRRQLIRLVLVGQPLQPAMMLERVYGVKKKDETLLFYAAAQELAVKLDLPLYRGIRSNDISHEKLTLLSGRSPFDYFDSAGGVKTRMASTITAVPLKLPFPETEKDSS